MRRAIVSGVPGTPMTGFGQMLSDRDLDRLVEVVLSFASKRAAGEPTPLLDASIARHLERAAFIPESRHRLAPVFTVQGSDEKALSLEGLRGRLVLVVFWATTCGPCLQELPALERLADRFRDAALIVLPVCVEEAPQGEAFAVASARARHLPVYTDRNNQARLRYEIQALPAAVLIDRAGRLLGSAQGGRNWAGPEVQSADRNLPGRPLTDSDQRSARSRPVGPCAGQGAVVRTTASSRTTYVIPRGASKPEGEREWLIVGRSVRGGLGLDCTGPARERVENKALAGLGFQSLDYPIQRLVPKVERHLHVE